MEVAQSYALVRGKSLTFMNTYLKAVQGLDKVQGMLEAPILDAEMAKTQIGLSNAVIKFWCYDHLSGGFGLHYDNVGESYARCFRKPYQR